MEVYGFLHYITIFQNLINSPVCVKGQFSVHKSPFKEVLLDSDLSFVCKVIRTIALIMIH